MTAPGNDPLIITLLVAFLACTGYAGGRLHQWYRMGRDRDDAFRDGYDTATRSVFTLAARAISPWRADRSETRAATVNLPASAVTTTGARPITATGSVATVLATTSAPAAGHPAVPAPADQVLVESSGRHTVPDELVQAATYRLNADRVARAKVPGAILPDGEREPRRSVPKPRVS